EFHWRIVEGAGAVRTLEQAECSVTSSELGQVVVAVQATQGELTAEDQVAVKFLENPGDATNDSGKGLPSYRLEPDHGKLWRSRYDFEKNEIVINSAHRDFIANKTTAAKHRRYVGKLYAKEVVLINFPHESPGDLLERLIEITLRIEDVL